MNADPDAAPCCDLHGIHCEPPADLCCHDCPEATHPDHRPGERCVLVVTVELPGISR